MIRFTIYPNLVVSPQTRSNPYIQDYIRAIESYKGLSVVNPPHKNPLKSILSPAKWGDIFIFNWFESIPDFKYGILQSFVAIIYLFILKLFNKKIIWMLHNKKPHSGGKTWMKRLLTDIIAQNSDLIITHASEGIDVIKNNYPDEINKVHFLHHPTIDRINESYLYNEKKYDLLIWGTITPYKGIIEFIDYIRNSNNENTKICIIGKGNKELINNIRKISPSNVTLIEESPSFEELSVYISQTKFVLCTYNPESILSSGMLMDSLSFGAKVIGPNVGSFKDYSKESKLKVYTFNKYDDIIKLIRDKAKDEVSFSDYKSFLEDNNWNNFINRLINIINNK